MDFKDKVVVITGGSQGIGRALVDYFLNAGAKVGTCSRHFDALYEMQTAFSGKPLNFCKADVSNESDCELFIKKVIRAFGTIDILINNAGISMRSNFEETELDTLKSLMDTNFWGAVYCTKYALPYIKKQKGMIVGVASIAGYRGLPGRTGYAASKHAMVGWLEALRVEMMSYNVDVIWICPGFTKSNIRKIALNAEGEPKANSLLNEDKLMSAEETAMHIVQSIKKKKRNRFLTAQGIQAIWLTRLWPSLADKLIRRFYYNEKGDLIK